MSAPRTLAEALAQCTDQHLGPSACADLITPFCEGRGVIMEFGKLPRCVGGVGSAQKSAIQRAEIGAAPRAGLPWSWIVGGAAGLALLAYVARER